MTGKAHTTMGQLLQGSRPKKRAPLKVGRVTKLTPEVSKRICDAVRAGNFISVAARYAGVSEHTVMVWLKRGRGDHPELPASPIYRQFCNDIDEAEAAAEVAAVLHWRAAMPKDWHSSEKWLKVKHPQRWEEKPLDQTRVGAFAGVNVTIGPGMQGSVTASDQQALSAPLEHLLEENPALIAGTMQILDQFLPIGSNTSESAETGVESASDAQTDVIPGEFTVIDPESEPPAPNGAFGGHFDPISPNSPESASESAFWRNSAPDEDIPT